MSKLLKEIFVKKTGERRTGIINKYSPTIEDTILEIEKGNFNSICMYELKVVLRNRFYCKDEEYGMAIENANRQIVHYIYADVYEKTRAIISSIHAGDAEMALTSCNELLDLIDMK